MDEPVNLFWFRRDLRLTDNHGLYQALSQGKTVCFFILDTTILKDVAKDNLQLSFIVESLKELKEQLNLLGSDLIVQAGTPEEVIGSLISK
jgi:deoxyribodipyrimidine photo-lyase